MGSIEYINEFFDVIDDASPWGWRSWGCFTADEVQALDAVLQVVTAACEAMPQLVSEHDLAASGWPSRIGSAATSALLLMQSRGRFREDAEEDDPSLPC